MKTYIGLVAGVAVLCFIAFKWREDHEVAKTICVLTSVILIGICIYFGVWVPVHSEMIQDIETRRYDIATFKGETEYIIKTGEMVTIDGEVLSIGTEDVAYMDIDLSTVTAATLVVHSVINEKTYPLRGKVLESREVYELILKSGE